MVMNTVKNDIKVRRHGYLTKMEKISQKDYRNFCSWAKANTANMVYPCSIAEGIQSGDIYVNDGSNVESVFFWHYCGFGYISGKASDKFMNEIYSEIISNHKNKTIRSHNKRLILITSDENIITFFRDKEVLMDSRAEYSYLHPRNVVTLDSDEFQVEQIDAENIQKIEGRIIPSFSWESSEQFLKEGFGYLALDHGRVCAVAFSAAVSSDEVDIGVETHEDYRRKGLAAMLAGQMCERIVEGGKRPVWAHSVSNKASMNTAIKCGFVQDRINTVIKKKDI